MDKRAINIGLNRLKDKNPANAAILEGVQQLFNDKVNSFIFFYKQKFTCNCYEKTEKKAKNSHYQNG